LGNSNIDQRLDTFNKVKELQSKGFSKKKISRDLEISRNTVRSYFIQESLTPKAHTNSTNIDLFTGHILARLHNGGYHVKDIIVEITELGYNGSQTQAYTNINRIKEDCGIYTPDFIQIQQTKIPYIKPLNSRKLAKYIDFRIAEMPNPDERNYMKTLLDNIPELRVVRKLVS